MDKNENINWEKVEERMEKAAERKKHRKAKFEEASNNINEKINKHVDRVNAKINAINWDDISNQFEQSAENIKNAKWDNVVREDKRIDWDFLGSQIDMVVDQFTDSIDIISAQLDKMQETETVEVVVPEESAEPFVADLEPLVEN